MCNENETCNEDFLSKEEAIKVLTRFLAIESLDEVVWTRGTVFGPYDFPFPDEDAEPRLGEDAVFLLDTEDPWYCLMTGVQLQPGDSALMLGIVGLWSVVVSGDITLEQVHAFARRGLHAVGAQA